MVRFSKTAVLVLTAVFAAAAVFIGIKDAKWDESEAALFYVQIASPSGQERIDCWKGTEGDYYVFLPSYADPSEIKIAGRARKGTTTFFSPAMPIHQRSKYT